jgi:hypothetical protein
MLAVRTRRAASTSPRAGTRRQHRRKSSQGERCRRVPRAACACVRWRGTRPRPVAGEVVTRVLYAAVRTCPSFSFMTMLPEMEPEMIMKPSKTVIM